jgi:hypothetical protein
MAPYDLNYALLPIDARLTRTAWIRVRLYLLALASMSPQPCVCLAAAKSSMLTIVHTLGTRAPQLAPQIDSSRISCKTPSTCASSWPAA